MDKWTAAPEEQNLVVFVQWRCSVASDPAQSSAVRNRIFLSEVVGETQRPEGRCEVCTSAEGLYEESKARLIVKLDCCLRPLILVEQDKKIQADWLPPAETVTASVSQPEASDMTKEIFGSWVKLVRKSIP
jgi:hypothetical protein